MRSMKDFAALGQCGRCRTLQEWLNFYFSSFFDKVAAGFSFVCTDSASPSASCEQVLYRPEKSCDNLMSSAWSESGRSGGRHTLCFLRVWISHRLTLVSKPRIFYMIPSLRYDAGIPRVMRCREQHHTIIIFYRFILIFHYFNCCECSICCLQIKQIVVNGK